ncbi:hypothetical protein [Bradyrhizobium sp. DOA9]|uniref:hypothetical protein n=1 Tax=Bradyrhizobium sp. DOA9 TaxID=1126627 RepID=UPI0004695D58|nr:hypothetical protein [Bradyrhizobium sp. DOA9]GAJ31425.1 hypothetical protein BDOA9_0106040 [Bradyrhizobium sp. DOA9]
MQFDRRTFLISALTLLGYPTRRAYAVEPMTVMAVVSAASNVGSSALEFFKKSGDFENELNALHVKLDQLLRNQLTILQAVSDLATDVKLIVEKLGKIPTEVIAAQHLSDSALLCSTLADAFDHGTPKDIVARINGPNGAYELAARLDHASSYALPAPNVALAAHNVLNSIDAVAKKAGKQTLNEVRSRLVDASTYLRASLERMTARGIKANFPNPATYQQATSALRNHNKVLRILPEDFDAKRQDVGQEIEDVRQVCTMHAGGEKATSNTSSFCVTRGKGDYASEFCTYSVNVDVYTNVIRSKFKLRRKVFYGGKSFYELDNIPSDQWERFTWVRHVSRIKHSGENWSTLPDSKSDDPGKIAGCRSVFIDEKTGLPPGELDAFLNAIQLYDSYVAEESRLLSIQAVASADLERCKRISSILRA